MLIEFTTTSKSGVVRKLAVNPNTVVCIQAHITLEGKTWLCMLGETDYVVDEGYETVRDKLNAAEKT